MMTMPNANPQKLHSKPEPLTTNLCPLTSHMSKSRPSEKDTSVSFYSWLAYYPLFMWTVIMKIPYSALMWSLITGSSATINLDLLFIALITPTILALFLLLLPSTPGNKPMNMLPSNLFFPNPFNSPTIICSLLLPPTLLLFTAWMISMYMSYLDFSFLVLLAWLHNANMSSKLHRITRLHWRSMESKMKENFLNTLFHLFICSLLISLALNLPETLLTNSPAITYIWKQSTICFLGGASLPYFISFILPHYKRLLSIILFIIIYSLTLMLPSLIIPLFT